MEICFDPCRCCILWFQPTLSLSVIMRHRICRPFTCESHAPNAETIQYHNHRSLQWPISLHASLSPMILSLIIESCGCVAGYKKLDDNGKKHWANTYYWDHPIQHISVYRWLSNTGLQLQCERTEFDCKINENLTNVQHCALLFDPEITKSDVSKGKWIHEHWTRWSAVNNTQRDFCVTELLSPSWQVQKIRIHLFSKYNTQADFIIKDHLRRTSQEENVCHALTKEFDLDCSCSKSDRISTITQYLCLCCNIRWLCGTTNCLEA